MAYGITEATFKAACTAATRDELTAINNTQTREALKKVLDALVVIISAEFAIVEAG